MIFKKISNFEMSDLNQLMVEGLKGKCKGLPTVP